jgi:HPt (histidine-containing phosphotransfer) domain-containing protein
MIESPAADTARDTLAPFDGRPPPAERTRAEALARFELDEGFYARLVPLFRQAALDQSRALTAAAARGDGAQLQHWAHTLKGSLLTVGANLPAAHAERIEQLARERRLDGVAALVAQVVAEAAVVVEQLDPDGGRG